MHSPMKNIFIYNLDHDYALGDNSSNFTPQKSVLRMRNIFACFPALYANDGDYILYLDSETNNIPNKDEEFKKAHALFSPLMEAKRLSLVSLKDLSSLDLTDFNFQPWGWDLSLVCKLERYGVDPTKIPDYKIIQQLRNASSRFTSIRIYQELMHSLKNQLSNPHYELFNEFGDIIETSDTENVLNFFRKFHNIYVKAPWSSSGRGLIFTDELNETQVKQWCNGIIRKQGGVVMERAYKRALDFSSEWILHEGHLKFVGYGMFTVSSRGKYKGNYVGESSELKHLIIETIHEISHLEYSEVETVLNKLISLQKDILLKYFRRLPIKDHIQPLGIDMFVTTSGAIHPCVEVNLRNTMGHVALEINRQRLSSKDDSIQEELAKFVTGNMISLPEII